MNAVKKLTDELRRNLGPAIAHDKERVVRACADTINEINAAYEDLPDDWPVVVSAGELLELKTRCAELYELNDAAQDARQGA